MTIDGRYYTEPELTSKFRQMQETIDRYEAENRKLTEENEELGGLYNDASLGIGYLEQRCEELETREKEYKRLLKEAVEYIKKFLPEVGTCDGCAKYDEETCTCKGNPLKCRDECEWEHEAEALDLIGEEEET